MACRKMGLREEQKTRNAAAVGDVLLFATMCIIGMPVEVHTRDGSVYSGTFHTASVDNYDAIVLKKARMTKKEYQDVNVLEGNLIETLIVQSEDFVQVVAKGVTLPSNGFRGNVAGDSLQAIAGHIKCLDEEANVSKMSKVNKKCKSKKRSSAKRKNGFWDSSSAKTANVFASSLEGHNSGLDTIHSVKIDEVHSTSVDERQVRNGSIELHTDSRSSPELQAKRTTQEDQRSIVNTDGCEAQASATVDTPEETNMQQIQVGVPSDFTVLHEQGQERPAPDVSRSNGSFDSVTFVDLKSESPLSADSLQFIPPKSLSLKKTVKESKLNPGAKLYSPSTLHYRSGTPPLMPNGANYMSDSYAMAPYANAHQTVDASCFPHSSVPLKFIPYNNNMAIVNGANDTAYGQPIMGQMVGRMQPTRYAGQYNNFQTGENYIYPNPQNVIYGRGGPVLCMHPISSDVAQSEAARAFVTPHQMHNLAKHQGNALAPTLQLCMTPQGPQQYIMSSSIPLPPPVYPGLRPCLANGLNGFLNTKFT